jgi:hypothetical protein
MEYTIYNNTLPCIATNEFLNFLVTSARAVPPFQTIPQETLQRKRPPPVRQTLLGQR